MSAFLPCVEDDYSSNREFKSVHFYWTPAHWPTVHCLSANIEILFQFLPLCCGAWNTDLPWASLSTLELCMEYYRRSVSFDFQHKNTSNLSEKNDICIHCELQP